MPRPAPSDRQAARASKKHHSSQATTTREAGPHISVHFKVPSRKLLHLPCSCHSPQHRPRERPRASVTALACTPSPTFCVRRARAPLSGIRARPESSHPAARLELLPVAAGHGHREAAARRVCCSRSYRAFSRVKKKGAWGTLPAESQTLCAPRAPALRDALSVRSCGAVQRGGSRVASRLPASRRPSPACPAP